MHDGNKEISTVSKAIGIATNNIAEYTALIEGLKHALELGYSEVLIKADSELMVKQLKREYKVKNPDIQVIYTQAQGLIERFSSIQFQHIPREQNKRADQLANMAL